MSTTGTCPRCGTECVVRYREGTAAEYLCQCRHPGSDQAAGERAISQAGENAPAAWMAEAIGTVRLLAESQAKFTADDIWRLTGAPPEPRALGAVMRRAQRDGLAEATDQFVTSERRHGAPIRVWRSLLFGGRAVSECLYCDAPLDGLRPEAKFCGDLHKAAWHRENPKSEAA